MRPTMIVAFLLLLTLLLVAAAQGIHLEGAPSGGAHGKLRCPDGGKPSSTGSAGVTSTKEESESLIAAGSPRGTALCNEDGRCSGKSRKLLMEAPTVTHKTKRGQGVEAEGSSRLRPTEGAANSFPEKPAVSEHKQKDLETYPGILDIAGMDYSPAVRKPPIHN